jgi:5'-hydroxyaverantin dehydrogenase
VPLWTSRVAAFKAAIAFSPSDSTVDMVLAAAGVFGIPLLAADKPAVALENDPPAPSMVAVEVNTIGSYYTAKLAQLYFVLPGSPPTLEPKSLILISSLVAYFDIPPMNSHTASKFSVRGIFHSIRPMFADRGMRVNPIAL